MSKNAEVAQRLEELADRLEAMDVEYKPRAYRRAAENVRDVPTPIEDLTAEGVDALDEIEGVGEAIGEKIVEYVETGEIAELERLREELPVEMDHLTSVEGVGPKTVGALYEALEITTLDELEAAAEAGAIQDVEGFGAKTEANILENIPFAREVQSRELLGDARPLAEDALDFFADLEAAETAEVAGSIRRWRATIGDVDVLVAATDGEPVVEAFTGWERVERTIEAGTTKASVVAGGLRVDLRVVAPTEFGAALQYFTGSKDHNVRVRQRAIDRDLKMNEYGVFDVADVDAADDDQRAGERVAGETEESMYAAVDLPWIPPELREDHGEVAAAAEGTLPDPIEEGAIRGDLHTHTDWSDGSYTIAEMVEAADAFGHQYHCVSDHATGPGMVGGVGLDDDELREQAEAVAAVGSEADIEVLHGVETNIDAKGGLSTGDDVLADLDLVVASPHSALGQSGEAATDRLVAAVEHPHVDVLGHPSGRLLNRRPGLEFDVERVATAAAAGGTALEINANPHRLDLWGSAVKTAVDVGATVAINTDAHSPAELAHVRYGIHTARRGWAAADDVLNAGSLEDVLDFVG